MKRIRTVDEFFQRSTRWPAELKRLREILNSTNLEEELKWGMPCYTHDGKNVVGIAAFKSYFGLWFFQGSILEDDKKVLVNAQEGKTKFMRQWRMTGAGDIQPRLIRQYVKEAIQKKM